MKWVLVALIVWADTPPLTVIQIAVATKELCEQAAQKVRTDFGASAAGASVGGDETAVLRSPLVGPSEETVYGYSLLERSGVVTSCLQISN
jgi:hypothetical protein